MRYNRLGNTGLLVSELSLGTMTFGQSRWGDIGGVEQDVADRIIRRALDGGINVLDTADVYSDGQSEIMTGRALRNLGVRREDVIIATKTYGPVGDGPNDRGSSRAHILDSVTASLKRLQLDYIDLYQLHGFDPLTPIEESLLALDHVVRQGMVRYVGVSNWAAWQMATALGISARLNLTNITAVQAYYSLVGRELEHEITPFLESTGMGLIVWSPLAGGLLSGKFGRDVSAGEGSRRNTMAFPPVETERAYDIIDVLRSIADARSVSVAQVALSWLLHRLTVTTVLIGAKSVGQLEDNLGATDLVLSAEELAVLDDASRLPLIYPRWMNEVYNVDRFNQFWKVAAERRTR
ncbi:aldo/keto reductase [Dickeya fangzhongdai]|uniref:aldo/keto reductase n=1 Tax=Dickeya fangzhongdai TaxID=1778540 RepID=UPI00136B3814|nr:aldo/keto reductase [Dickeya fangzhongdai]UMB75674.1 aldo/keto reductase [Dickeya fangzhongdai]